MISLGFDTSNYTSSVAFCDSDNPSGSVNVSLPLRTEKGKLGLRQSEAVFQHVKQLPAALDKLAERVDLSGLAAVGASVSPREAEGSYMPCFLVGEGAARLLATSLKLPFFGFSHQQGHIASALWSIGLPELLDSDFLAWHLSGGTSELLLVRPEKGLPRAHIIGGTKDLSAGQLIDRAGGMLGLDFPSGQELDRLALVRPVKGFKVKADKLEFSLSGVENKAASMAESEDIAGFVMDTLAMVIAAVTEKALAEYSGLPLLFTGGVSSSAYLRNKIGESFKAYFASADMARDNAMGIACLASRML